MNDQYELQPVSARPFNAETPLGVLENETTPTDLFYVRNHFDVPSLDVDRFKLTINGAVAKPLELSLDQIKELPEKNSTIVMECAGNGRSSMTPKIKGTSWNLGAISQAVFSGTSLHNILDMTSLSDDVREIRFSGADQGKIHSGETEHYIRSLPLEVANHPDTLIVWKMNDQDLTSQHGYPLRLIVPGWYGMASVKWLQEITAITQPFTGFFQSKEYVYIGEHGIPDQTPVANMRVRSLITNPEVGTKISGETIHISGIAWSGEGMVEKVELSFNQGENWQLTTLNPASTIHGLSRWEFDLHPEEAGRYSIIARATDSAGNEQPLKSIWNKGGYGNNAAHQIELTIE